MNKRDVSGKEIEITKARNQVTEYQGGIEIRREGRAISRRIPDRVAPIIGVTYAGYDNIGEILSKMGYKFETFYDYQLADAEFVSHFDILFLNCSADCRADASRVGEKLKNYVYKGGSIYASDWAAAYLGEAFPGMFEFDSVNETGEFQVRVDDKGLELLLGKNVKLNFDMGGWIKTNRIQGEYRRYLTLNDTPLLFSVKYGRGQMVFTSFHNRAQATNLETELLQFLVLKPLVASVSLNISNTTTSDTKFIQETPVASKLGKGKVFCYEQSTKGTLLFMVNWASGSAKFKLMVWHPNGALYHMNETTKPPCSIRVPEAEVGIWKYQAIPIVIPYPNFPYSVSVGPEAAMLKALPPAM